MRSNLVGLPVPPTRTVVVGERIEPMDSDTPVKLTPSATFDQVPDPTIARMVQLGIEYDPKPPHGSIQPTRPPRATASALCAVHVVKG